MPAQRSVIGLILSSGLALALIGVQTGCSKQPGSQTMAAGPPIVPVTVAPVAEQSVPTELRVIGTVDASSVVQIKSQIAGQIEKVGFTEGQNVAKDEVLFQ